LDLLVNFLVTDVAPENHARPEDEVEGGGTFGFVDDGRHLVVVERDFPDVVAPGEEQRGVALGGLAPGVVAGLLLVVVQALTLERALLVDARLRAGARCVALVDVCNTN